MRRQLDAPVSTTRINRPAIVALATATFVYVTAEAMPVGLLPQISSGLSVSEAQVGLLLTSYAAVVAATTIPLTALTMRIPRHRLIAGMVVIFAISQGAAALAPTFAILILSRLLCAVAHGVFWSAIAPAAVRMAPPEQAGRVTSLVFVGNSAALVLGVPLTTALGQVAGWRSAFIAVAIAGVLSAIALVVVLPPLPAVSSQRSASVTVRMRSAGSMIRSRAMTPVCAVTTIAVVAQFATYTYIAPLVRRNGGLDGLGLSLLLLGYGVVGILGNLVLGRFVDRRPGVVLAGSILTVSAAMLALAFTRGTGATIVAILVWGIGFSVVPAALQAAVLRVSSHAQDSASAVYVVAFQVGIGGGALIGEQLVTGARLGALPLLGAAVAAAAGILVLSFPSTFPLRRPAG